MNTPTYFQTNNFFDHIKASDSIEIYKQFAAGKVIVKNVYNEFNATLEENPLYTVIFNNLKHFEQLYQHIGFTLEFHSEGDFFYICEQRDSDTNEADDNALKIQVILLLIGRYFSRSGRDLELLCQSNAGLDDIDVKQLSLDEEYQDILRTIKLKEWKEALDLLTKRNFAFRTGANSLFLSSAGKAFLFRLVEEYKVSGESVSKSNLDE